MHRHVAQALRGEVGAPARPPIPRPPLPQPRDHNLVRVVAFTLDQPVSERWAKAWLVAATVSVDLIRGVFIVIFRQIDG